MNVSLVVGVPALQWNDTRSITSFIELRASGCIGGYAVVGATLLPDARNAILRILYENNPDFTHMLFIDDDMCGYDIDHVKLLIAADKPIISALVTTRRKPYNIVTSHEELTREETIKRIAESQVRESEYVGMAFTLIKREVLDQLREETPNGPIWFNTDREVRNGFLEECEEFIEQAKKNKKSIEDVINDAIAFGMSAHITSNIVGEDYAFCKKANKFGFNSFVHWAVIVGHLGTQPITVRDVMLERLQNEVSDSVASSVPPNLRLAGV